MNKNIVQNLVFNVSKLANAAEGTADTYELDIPVDFDEPLIKPLSNLKGTIKIIKLDKEFNVQIKDIEIDIEKNCDKCLKTFTEHLEIPLISIEFLIQPLRNIELSEDVFYVNTKNWTIDIKEWLRQEIILHFPLISVCSLRCEGITP